MKNVRSIFVHIDAIAPFGEAVAADVAAFVDDETAESLARQFVSSNGPKQSGAHYQNVETLAHL